MTRHPLFPLLIGVVAIAVAAGFDAVVKGIGERAGLFTLLAWRFAFGTLMSGAVFAILRRRMPEMKALRFHALRGAIQIGAAWSFFYAILQLGLAEAVTLGFTAALMLPFIARLILGERIRPAILVSTLTGFAGVMLVISGDPATPSAGHDRALGIASVLFSAALYALSLTLLRLRTRREDAVTLAFMSNLFPMLILFPAWLATHPPGVPALWPVFALLGLLGYVIWLLLSLAYARAPAQHLAPIEYTALIWAGLLGAVFFNETPPWQLYAGAAIIIAACLGVAVETHYATRREARAPVSAIDEI